MSYRYGNNKIHINYDIGDDLKKFVWQFKKSSEEPEKIMELLPHNTTTFNALKNEENKIAKEFAEVLTLNLNIERYLEYINKLNEENNIRHVAEEVENTNNISETLIDNLHILTEWWFKVNEILGEIKKELHKAVEMDKQVAEHLDEFFSKEKRAELKETRLKVAKTGLLGLAKISIGFIPVIGGILGTAWEFKDLGKDIRESIKETEKDN